jgi:hypothetical protein
MRIGMLVIALTLMVGTAFAKPPKDAKIKFYDFSDQLINGQIKKPTQLWVDARQKVKFDRLLKLKKSFIPDLLKTAKDPVFR